MYRKVVRITKKSVYHFSDLPIIYILLYFLSLPTHTIYEPFEKKLETCCFLLNYPIKLLTLAIRVPSPLPTAPFAWIFIIASKLFALPRPTQPSSIPPPLCSSRAVGLQEKSSTMTLASQDLLALEPIISFHLCFLYVH